MAELAARLLRAGNLVRVLHLWLETGQGGALHTVHCAALDWASLHYTVLHCTALHCTALHCTVLRCTALHCTALSVHGTMGHTVRHGIPCRGCCNNAG